MSVNRGRFNSLSRSLPQDVDLIFDDKHGVYLARFSTLSSRASGSLGAPQPASEVLKMAMERAGGTKCISVSDELSMEACLRFAGEDDHQSMFTT